MPADPTPHSTHRESLAQSNPEASDSGDGAKPRDLKVKIAEQKLVIDWVDGKQSEYAFAQLRRVCPCATCKTERSRADANPLKILKADPSDLRVVNARLVGNYAIQLYWSDGHNTGMFDFRFLRSLSS